MIACHQINRGAMIRFGDELDHRRYAGNTTECFVAGKIAGQNTAAERGWE